MTTLRVESRHFAATAPAFSLPHLHLAPSLGVTAVEFCQDFRQEKTRVFGLSCGVVCVILRLAFSLEHRPVTDRQIDRQTDPRRQLIQALASVARVKIAMLRRNGPVLKSVESVGPVYMLYNKRSSLFR